MSFYFLLLGHLFGDFTLQTEKIALNKTKHMKWNLLHTVIVTICMLFFSLPFGFMTMGLVLINGVSHYFIDSFKSKFQLRTPFQSLIYFILDQMVHISIIFLISILSPPKTSILFVDEKYITLLLILVCFVSFMSIFIQYLLKVFYPSYNHIFFFKHEKLTGDITRLVLFIIYTISSWLSLSIILLCIPLLMVMIGLFYKKRCSQWMSWNYICVRLVMDLLVSTIGFYFFLYIYL